MDRVFRLDIKIIFIIFAILDLFCIAMGMGVPIFCILFGFPIGWLFLMIFISPFLQLLTTIFTSYLTLLKWLKNNKTAR